MNEEIDKELTDQEKMVKECDEMALLFLDIVNKQMCRPFIATGALQTAMTSICLNLGISPHDYAKEVERIIPIYKGLYEQHRKESTPDGGAES